ncbi:hypothetical protein T440DRAFT_521645 [Plenodomus tracheiphilus IPT5]|uniref:Uncharacterized protein n=1 Tax=Plenodomus tracheiphilus IPT5 TaxID=1408161 RepID=A0A6A7AUB1_9PLEO|nr:hypothetical protein T440DRAFT_521645 [Plenodomus tracheiphilus IPT5]
MPSNLSPQPFRFLDLPGEIRNNIYGLLLCSWNDELDQDPELFSKLSKRCPSYPATALLRTNKQIQAEASDYMIKRNQFVRVTCRGLDVRKLFLGDRIPVITTDGRRTSQFQGYVMHMTLSKPAFSLSAFQFSDVEIMMLRSDLPRLCEQLDIESVMEDANSTAHSHASLRAEVKLNYSFGRFFTLKIQERLLAPIATLLRGIPNMRILGPVDPALAQAVTAEVAQPRWTDPKATLEEVGTGVDVGKRQWQQNNFYSAAESWAYAMRTLERMRHSSSWRGLSQAGGEDFVNKIADLYFTLNLLHAQFLQVDMASEHASAPLIQRNGNLSIQHLRKCETASARFAQHAGATWVPSNAQSAKMLFRQARCLRLMRDTANRVKAVTLIEEAAVLTPNEMAIRDERDVIFNWNAEIDASQRVLPETFAVASSPRSGILSYIWTAVTGLAA